MNIDNQDLTTQLLAKIQNDKSILSFVVDTIFSRNRKGLFTDDLVWAFFEARSPYSLMLLANFLGSNNLKDVELACRLLDFVPSIDMSFGKNTKKQYRSFLYWLEENYPFLHFTGESFQRTSRPIPYIVTLDAKYLYKGVSIHTGKPLIPLSYRENNLLNLFNDLNKKNKLLLSTFSVRLHYDNIYLWRAWINYSIDKQIIISKSNFGGKLNDCNFW